ncbi:MAG: hypothetical protein IT233_12380 [Bacteroidia bacterium]|nr:hypothetical protein [Bacteroidia bacterium]
MRYLLTLALLNTALFSAAQNDSTTMTPPLNAVNTIIHSKSENKLTIGAYGQVEYTRQFGDTAYHNALIDVHRLVMFLGYKFNDKTHFVGELEFEHVNEAAVEQAFINYQLTKWMDLRTGLLLVPMGIINEYHEPTTFNGTIRPNIDKNIIPSTWRELGAGVTGKFNAASVRYQLYAMNGFMGYDGTGKFKGSDGLRGGRQKGIKSVMTTPDFSVKVDYYGVKNLKVGLAGYFGESESKLYEGLWKEDTLQNARAKFDSSLVGISMTGVDVRYKIIGVEFRAQYILCSLSNTESYNKLTGKDLGASMAGYYVELGYNILEMTKCKKENKLIVFGRYEDYDTHASVAGTLTRNKSFHRKELTAGIGYFMGTSVAFKADFSQLSTDQDNDVPKKYFNMGFGFWF